jgi:leader peptidase (prepilin peptidase)/N-methyltransferase
MPAIDLIFLGILVGLLAPIVVIDLRERRIPNTLNLLLAVSGVAWIVVRFQDSGAIGVALLESAVAAILLALVCVAVRAASKRAHIGWGDVKFLMAAGFWTGFQGAFLMLFLASVLVILAAIVRLALRRAPAAPTLPFGPMLATALVAVFVGRSILQKL